MYKGISQYEITHMENLMVRDDYWNDDYDDVRTICDIMDNCKDCPRMGDDCDGKDDDNIAYYERQGDEYVYYDENEHELFREPV
jgi:hypothetical protein